MFLMMAEVLELAKVAAAAHGNPVWDFLAFHQTHALWSGCSLHDLIQPSFSFLVGAALPFSLAGRAAKGQKLGGMLAHAAWRSLLLIALGIFLRSIGKPRTYFTFEDTLTQIGLGYFFLFLLGLARPRGCGGSRSRCFSSATGRPSLFTRCRGRISTTTRPERRRIGRSTSAASPPTGTKTPTSPGRSTAGFSTCFRARTGSEDWHRPACARPCRQRAVCGTSCHACDSGSHGTPGRACPRPGTVAWPRRLGCRALPPGGNARLPNT